MRRALAAFALVVVGGCAAVLGFDDRTESTCAQSRGAHVLCVDFDQPGDVKGPGKIAEHHGSSAEAPGVTGRALEVTLPAVTVDAGAELYTYGFDDPRLLHASTMCMRFKVYFEHGIELGPFEPDADASLDNLFGADISLLVGLQLTTPDTFVPRALAFAVRAPPDTRLSPFAVGYTSDAGPQFPGMGMPEAGGGPFLQSLAAIELRDIPVGQWIDAALQVTIATGHVEIALSGATRIALPAPMSFDGWDGHSGIMLVGIHSYSKVGEVAVRYDDLVLDADGPCP